MVVAQNPGDLGHGTVTITGSALAELDATPIPATFILRSLAGQLTVSNLPSMCPSERTVSIQYDFARFGESHLRVNVLDTPDCSNPNNYCKGFLDANLGPPAR